MGCRGVDSFTFIPTEGQGGMQGGRDQGKARRSRIAPGTELFGRTALLQLETNKGQTCISFKRKKSQTTQ